jgi:hypothetical protein
MSVVDNFVSPGWQKDMAITVLSFDRQHSFNVAVPYESRSPIFWLRRKFGSKDFSLGWKDGEELTGRIEVIPVVQEALSNMPPLDNNRRSGIKWMIGPRHVVSEGKLVSNADEEDIAEAVKELVDKEVRDFETANFVSADCLSMSLSLSL